jgi:hypothetical protein
VISRLSQKSYNELSQYIDKPTSESVTAPDGKTYNIEIEAFWDDKPGGNLRIVISIDDGGWRTFAPLTTDFLIGADGKIV